MIQRKILLAEDDIDERTFFHNYLSSRTDIVLLPIAEDGEELINYLEKKSVQEGLPDLVILDQNMPRLNGLETLQYLKNSEKLEKIPVVIYSTYADENLARKGLGAGAMSVHSKPDSFKGYNELIDNFLRQLNTEK